MVSKISSFEVVTLHGTRLRPDEKQFIEEYILSRAVSNDHASALDDEAAEAMAREFGWYRSPEDVSLEFACGPPEHECPSCGVPLFDPEPPEDQAAFETIHNSGCKEEGEGP